ncbi:MAG: InlB B-repeat-containing protein, partial [Synergistaceae bacterium]|nr:InlB B-repeat-containing protein [Synergistaceae bacterium]
YSEVETVSVSDLESGVASIANVLNLLLGVSLDNVSDEVLADLQAMLFTVSFDANNGTGTMSPQGFVKDISAALSANTFTRTYYTFNGWNTSANGSGTAYADEATVTISENTRLYAQWRAIPYVLSYVLNGAVDPGNPKSYTVEDSITLQAPTKGGYTFTGWTGTDLTGTTESVTILAGSTGARSYTANFTPITYTITYDLDGGTNDAANPASYTIESDTITLKDPTKEGYDFAGWTMDGFAVTEIPAGSSGDKTITAKWGDVAPVLSAANYSLEAREGEPASLTINAAGLNLSWNLDGALPSGLAFSGEGSTASISGTPEAGTAGTYPVKVVAANEGGSASADVMITVASAGTESKDVESGDITSTSRDVKREEPVTTVADSGASTTHTTTTLTDSEGNVLLAAVIAITTESEEFAAVVGEEFSTRVNVDVSIDIRSTSYDKYAYLMEIFGLPEWLKADGTLESSGTLEAGQHYEFTLTGTPVASQDAQSVVFAATVMITGDTPEIEAYADKEVMLAVKAEAASGDITPKPGDSEQSPDATPEPVVIENGKITINADDS